MKDDETVISYEEWEEEQLEQWDGWTVLKEDVKIDKFGMY